MFLSEMFDRVWVVCDNTDTQYSGLIKKIWRFSSQAEADRGAVLLSHAAADGAYFPVTQTLSGTWLVLRVSMAGDLQVVKHHPIYAIGITKESAEKAAAKVGARDNLAIYNMKLQENPEDEAE